MQPPPLPEIVPLSTPQSEIDGIFVGLSQTISMIEWGVGELPKSYIRLSVERGLVLGPKFGKTNHTPTGQALGHAMRKSLGFSRPENVHCQQR